MSHYSRILSTIITIIAIFSSFVYIVIAAPKKLKIEVKVDKDLPIQKRLIELAKEMEKTAKIYQTTNQRAYWEHEGKKSFNKLLRSEGYYANTISVEIPSNQSNSIIFHISPWQQYTISKISITHVNNSNKNINIPNIKDLKIKAEQIAIAEKILSAQKELLNRIENNNCLLSIEVSHTAIINHLDNKIEINFLIDAGPSATIEKIDFTGLKQVKPDYAHKLVGLKNGQCFRQSYIIKARGYLQKSSLFASTTPTIPVVTNKDGSVPIIFNLIERKPRSLKAGVGYGTDLGLGASLGWEHRNFLGSGEKVDAELLGNQKEQIFELNYTKPFYRHDNQTLRLGAKAENRTSKAFKSKEGSISGILERQLTKKWTGGIGTRFSQSKIKESGKGKSQDFSLLSTPLFLIHDTRNNILDPKRGFELKIEGAPYFSVRSKEKPFFKTRISGSTYFSLPTKFKPVLAIRAATGSILGIDSVKIPHTERFYVGGSNSLRGYAYQLAGKLDKNKRPLGGRSFIETAIELRLKITEQIGIVGFLDSGLSYISTQPDTKQKLLHGAGFGVRYLTDFGPVRADIAFPLKRRKFIDNSYQLYFGIGQTF